MGSRWVGSMAGSSACCWGAWMVAQRVQRWAEHWVVMSARQLVAPRVGRLARRMAAKSDAKLALLRALMLAVRLVSHSVVGLDYS